MTSTFAPPTGPPATASTSAQPTAMGSLTVDSPPDGGRRRRPLVLAAAVVAVAALGVGAFAALTARGGSDATDTAQPFALAAAAQQAIDARSVEFDLTVTAGPLGDIAVSGAIDNETHVVSATTDLSSLLALGDTPLPIGGGETTVLFDGQRGVVYLGADALGGFLPTDAGWVSIDLGGLAEQSGENLDEVVGTLGVDPSDIARSLLDTDGATEVGNEVIDGVDTRHYTVSVDIAAALAAVQHDELDQTTADLDLPDTVVYDVWVTADNQLRRVAFDTEIQGQVLAMQLDLITSDEPLGIEIPDASTVFDLTGLLGF